MRSLRLFLAFALSFAVVVGPVRAAPGRLDVTRSDASAVELHWTCGRPDLASVTGEDGLYRRPDVVGAVFGAEPGAPDLPTVIQLVGIPAGPMPQIRVASVTTGEMALPDLAPGPQRKIEGKGASAHGVETRTRAKFPPSVVPSSWAEILGEETLRGQRTARVAIHPCRYDGSRGTLEWARDLVIRVEFPSSAAALGSKESRRDQADWEGLMNGLVPNAQVARAWRRPRTPAAESLRGGTVSFSSAPTWIHVPIRDTGVYILDYYTFQNLGIDPGTIDPRTIRVFSGRNTPLPINLLTTPPDPFMTECAIKDLGDGDGVFDISDRFLVYALGPNGWAGQYDSARSRTEWQQNKYTDETWYWITWGGSFPSLPKRMTQRSAADSTATSFAGSSPNRLHFEQNLTEDFGYKSEDGWMWEDLRGRGNDRQYTLSVDSPASGDGILQARMYSYEATGASDRRTVSLKVGGTPLVFSFRSIEYDSAGHPDTTYSSGTQWDWSNFVAPRQDVTGAFQHRLVDGPNTLRVDAVADTGTAVDLLYTGWFDLEYDRDLTARNNWLQFYSDPDSVAATATLVLAPGQSLPPGLVYGRHAYRLAGFDADTSLIYVFDVTNQHDVVELRSIRKQDAAAPHHVRFSDPTVSGVRWYVAMSLDAAKPLPAGQIASLHGLRDVSNGTEYLIIHHPDFKAGAERLASLRNAKWGRNASMVVDIDDVYQEFSWGMKDPVAIRDFLVYTQDHWTNGSPLYLALIGDASFDTKRYLSGSPTDYVPTYEDRYKEASFENQGSENPDFYPTDDFFAYLDPEDYLPPPSQPAVDVAVGRFPVSTPDQLNVMLDKVDSYLHYHMPGQWQNRMLLVADDERTLNPRDREPIHTQQVEALATQRVPPAVDKVKIYLVDYPRDVFGKKPEAEAAFIDEFTRGALMTTYTGHGDQSTMAQEEVFVSQKVPNLLNEERYTIFSTFSCTVSRFDLISGESLTELLLDHENGGAVTTFASGGLVYSDPSSRLDLQWLGEIYGTPYIIPTYSRDPRPLGLAALAAKAVVGASDPTTRKNNEKYVLLGDPALEVRFGRHLVQFDRPTVTSNATEGLLRKITGSVVDSAGAVLDGTNGTQAFQGTAFVHVTELPDTTGYDYTDFNGNPGPHLSFTLEGSTAYRGEVPIVNGRFDAKFYLNDGVRSGNTARVSVFALEDGPARDGSGAFDSLVVAPTISRAQVDDATGPVIVTRFEGYDRFIDGDQIFTDHPVMLISFEDPSGINLRPFPQFARLEAELDGRDRIDLAEDFSYKGGSFTQGQVRRILSLGAGEHTLEIKAYDNVGNRGSQKTRFTIVLPGGGFDLVDQNVAVYPNPFRDRADFLYRLTHDADVTLKVFTISGRLIREVKASGQHGDNVLAWDGRDERGTPLANGTYLYKLEAERLDASGKRQQDHYVGKVVRMR